MTHNDLSPVVSKMEVNLSTCLQKPLENTSHDEREKVAAFIAQVAQLPGFAASVATKVLHKKRPDFIPNLDNQTIFCAYMNPDWLDKPVLSYSIKDKNWSGLLLISLA